MNLLARLVLLSAAAVAGAVGCMDGGTAPILDQTGRAVVYGTVSTQGGQPVRGAMLKLKALSDAQCSEAVLVEDTAFSDGSGRYRKELTLPAEHREACVEISIRPPAESSLQRPAVANVAVDFISGWGDSVRVDAVLHQPQVDEYFSFENGLQGWEIAATDIDIGNDTINWHIQRSPGMAKHGTASLEFFLHNLNGAGKIWIVRGFPVRAGQVYRATLDFAFASEDFDAGAFTMIAGILRHPPGDGDDIKALRQGSTHNGLLEQPHRWIWLEKEHEFTIEADAGGMLYAVIGVWGTFERPANYFVDAIRVTLAVQ